MEQGQVSVCEDNWVLQVSGVLPSGYGPYCSSATLYNATVHT